MMTDPCDFQFLPDPPCMILVDKPVGVTSTRVVSIVKRVTKVKRTGHGGTLDPFASGLLPVLVGREFTRQADELLMGDKEYVMTVRFACETDTCDLTGVPTEVRTGPLPTRDLIISVLPAFTGEILQEPPIYSALKHQGKPLYWYARQGNPVTKEARTVRIDSIDFVEMVGPDAVFVVKCGKGTYMRSLGRDIGRAVGCPAHLVALRRTAVGRYRVEDAWPLWRVADARVRPVRISPEDMREEPGEGAPEAADSNG
jgi:tRNA pseudouridine55 synthase